MNTITMKLSAVSALILGLCFVTAATAHSSQPKVIALGTIRVTRADMEGAKHAVPAGRHGSTLYLGRIQVTPADSPDARDAALAARRSGSAFLGSITVTADDSVEARYAAAKAASHDSVYLGSVLVTPASNRSAFARELLAVERYVGSHPAFALVGALVFGRAGG